MKLRKKVILLSIVVFILLALVTILIWVNNKNKTIYMKLDFEDGVKKLNDFDSGSYQKLGWLQVQGTNIDLPILFFSSSEADLDYSYGWLSSVYNSNENREVLLGHNILNVSSTPMLSNKNLRNFEALMSFSYEDFARDNLYIQYTKNGKNEIYLIYAAGFYDYSEIDSWSISDPKLVKEYIDKVCSGSIYDYDIEVNEDDRLLTLKTCTRYFGVNKKQQFIVEARKIRDGEETLKYLVKANKNYDKLIKKENDL